MGRFFGTDGIRGRYGVAPLDRATVYAVGRALVRHARREGGVPPRFAIGMDTRKSGPELRDALIAGLSAERAGTVFDLGILPTPAIAFGGDRLGASLTIALTASHNPAPDNGIKLFLPGCRKLDPAAEAGIEAEIAACLETAAAGEISPVAPLPNPGARQAYLDHLRGIFEGRIAAGLRVALDTANGATQVTSPRLLRDLGLDLHGLGEGGEGTEINDGVGSEHPEALIAQVLATGADCGFAHDGDGDRLVVIDGSGARVDGDGLLGLLALRLRAAGEMPEPVLVTTVQSNSGLDAALLKEGIAVVRTAVGDRNVQERMIVGGATLGGENSGHLIYRPAMPTGDGLVALCLILRLFGREELRNLARIASETVRLFPQAGAAVGVREKLPLESCPGLQRVIAAAERELDGVGRLLVRYSGTEPKLRILVEAAESATAERLLGDLVAAAASELG